MASMTSARRRIPAAVTMALMIAFVVVHAACSIQ
jgi:hypothetical protein